MKKTPRFASSLAARDHVVALPGTPVAAWRLVARAGRTEGIPATRLLRGGVNAVYIAPPDRSTLLPATRRAHLGRLMITHCLVTRPSW
jgi:hypothetical protein